MIRNLSPEQGKRRLLIACPWGPAGSPKTLSGFPYHLIPCLREFFDVHVSDRISSPIVYGLRARAILKMQRILSSVRPYSFPGSRDVIARAFSGWLSGEVDRVRPDAVLTFGCAPVAYYKGEAPVFMYIDALYLYKARVYGWIHEDSLPDYERKSMRNIDLLGLDRCTRALFTSETIADESRRMFPDYREKMLAAGIGSNLEDEPAGDFSRPPLSDGLNLLFLSTNFERKGGPFAMQVLDELKPRFASVRLHIVGDDPGPARETGDIIHHGWIDKSSPEDRRRLKSILEKIHISLLPTLGDLSPHSICEMNSFGIPTVARDVGGIRDLIEDQYTGRVLDRMDPKVWADAVIELLDDLPFYSANARKLYEREQRWPVVAARIADQILLAGI